MPNTPIRERTFDQLPVGVYSGNATVGEAAAEIAADIVKKAIAERGLANLIIATGNSQLTFLHTLRGASGIRWEAVNIFQMNQYINLETGHPAGLTQFLRRHMIDRVPVAAFFPIPAHAADAELASRGYELLLRAHPADLCCLGIGENGHIAFNDPSVADFDDPFWVKVVSLDDTCRQQQVDEGHFPSVDRVPDRAITLTIPALRSARRMLCIVPEYRKADAVRDTLLGPISTACPASILRQTPNCRLLLDQQSASRVPELVTGTATRS